MLFSGMAATLGSIFIAYSKTKEVSFTTMLAGAGNIVLHFMLLNSCGLYAASVSTLISFLVLFVYRYFVIKSFFEIHFRIKKIVIQLAVLVFSWGAYSLKNNTLILIGFFLNLICIVLVLVSNKQIIVNLLHKRKK